MSALLERLRKLKASRKERLCYMAKLNVQKDGEEERKQEIDELLRNKVIENGIASIATSLTTKGLKSVVKVDDKKKDKKLHKQALIREFERAIGSDPEKYLEKAPDDALDAFMEALDLEFDSKTPKKDQREAIFTGIVEDGVRTLFANLQIEKETMLSFCKGAGLKVSQSHSKQQLIDAFVNGEVPEVEKKAKKPEAEKPCEKKPEEIKKGLKFADLFHHFQHEELKQWLKDHNVRNSGTKKEMAKRILAFLDGDTSEVIDPNAPKKGKRKAKEDTEKPSPKKQKVAKNKKKDTGAEEEKDDKEAKKEKDDKDAKKEKDDKDAKKKKDDKEVKKADKKVEDKEDKKEDVKEDGKDDKKEKPKKGRPKKVGK